MVLNVWYLVSEGSFRLVRETVVRRAKVDGFSAAKIGPQLSSGTHRYWLPAPQRHATKRPLSATNYRINQLPLQAPSHFPKP